MRLGDRLQVLGKCGIGDGDVVLRGPPDGEPDQQHGNADDRADDGDGQDGADDQGHDPEQLEAFGSRTAGLLF